VTFETSGRGLSSSGGSDVRRYVRALRRHLVMIVTLTVLGVGVSYIVSATSAKRYESTADLLVTPVSGNDDTFLGIDVFRESSDQSRSVLTVAHLVNSEQVAATAKTRLHSRLSPADLLRHTDVQPVGQADIVSIKATARNSNAAAAIANAFAAAIIQERTASFQHDVVTQLARVKAYLRTVPAGSQDSNQAITLQQRIAQLVPLIGAPDPTLRLASAATPPDAAVWPRPKLAAAIALLAILLLSSALAIAIEFWNPYVRDDNEIQLDHRLPILARVPRLRRAAANRYFAGTEPLPRSSWEAYRRLRASLDKPNASTPTDVPLSILITSPSPGEGKTMTSLNLALSFATAGKRVVLVDGDLRHPMIASIFRIAPPLLGIEAAFESKQIETLLSPAPDHPNLKLLLTRPENALIIDAVTADRVKSLIRLLAPHADVVIFDTAPVGEAAETLAFAAAADSTLLSIRLGSTRQDRLTDTLRLFAHHAVPLAGVVVTTDRGAEVSPAYYAYAGPEQPKLGSAFQAPVSVLSPAKRVDRRASPTTRRRA
jgi:Mrp family chromosome partitioning ATPase/capsular polysaccharide biosynthesis protein